jgi:hypothetical protein
MSQIVDNELWALREGETMELSAVEPADPFGPWFAVRIVPVPMPDGHVAPYRNLPNTASEQCAVIGAEKNSLGEWQWRHLSPSTKERIADWLLDECEGIERDRWYFVILGMDREGAAEATIAERKRLAAAP